MAVPTPFKGSDTQNIPLTAPAVTICKARLAEVTFQGEQLEVGLALDAKFDDVAGDKNEIMTLSHDEIQVLLLVLRKGFYGKSARVVAKTLIDDVRETLKSFYHA